jgi:phage shock protein A
MALINRINRLFRADMHAVLDRLEEPDVLLKQAVREMEDAIAHDEQRLKLLHHEQGQVDTRIEDLTETVQHIEGELDLCFSTKQEALARGLVKRRLESERFIKFLGKKSEMLAGETGELEGCVNENRNRLQAMRQKLELLTEEPTRSADRDTFVDTGPEIVVRDDEVEVAFLHEQHKRKAS